MKALEYKREKVAYLKSNFIGVELNESRSVEDANHLEFPPYKEDAL